MKNLILLLVVLFISLPAFAQENESVKYEKIGDLTEATYFYADGTIQQQGTFNQNGKLHGIWTSYDVNGDKLSIGNYENGEKVGKWFFWTEDTLREVDYSDSKILSVNQMSNKSQLAISN